MLQNATLDGYNIQVIRTGSTLCYVERFLAKYVGTTKNKTKMTMISENEELHTGALALVWDQA